ncbi:hypothetical protein MUP77_02665, partial [Candidatus Bathyarchaeota archaeon]|nr:hypothetical protein [Candidatus Bathyarchaeota archaeon]
MSMADVGKKLLLAIYLEQTKEPLGFVSSLKLQSTTDLSVAQVDGAGKYLEEKMLIDVRWTFGAFFARMTSMGIDKVESEGLLDEKTRAKNRGVREDILGILYGLYTKNPDGYSNKESLSKTLKYDQNEILFNIRYWEGKSEIQVEWFLGGDFLARISSSGIDSVERSTIQAPTEEAIEEVRQSATDTITVRPVFPISKTPLQGDLVFVLMPFDR